MQLQYLLCRMSRQYCVFTPISECIQEFHCFIKKILLQTFFSRKAKFSKYTQDLLSYIIIIIFVLWPIFPHLFVIKASATRIYDSLILLGQAPQVQPRDCFFVFFFFECGTSKFSSQFKFKVKIFLSLSHNRPITGAI